MTLAGAADPAGRAERQLTVGFTLLCAAESYAEAITPVLDQTMSTLYGTDLSRHPEPVRPR